VIAGTEFAGEVGGWTLPEKRSIVRQSQLTRGREKSQNWMSPFLMPTAAAVTHSPERASSAENIVS